jgi:hypothetical protein
LPPCSSLKAGQTHAITSVFVEMRVLLTFFPYLALNWDPTDLCMDSKWPIFPLNKGQGNLSSDLSLKFATCCSK